MPSCRVALRKEFSSDTRLPMHVKRILMFLDFTSLALGIASPVAKKQYL